MTSSPVLSSRNLEISFNPQPFKEKLGAVSTLSVVKPKFMEKKSPTQRDSTLFSNSKKFSPY